MSSSSATYSRFFTPQTISLLFCLQEVTKQPNEINPNDPLVTYLIDKILKITQAPSTTSNQQFCAELLSITNDEDGFVTAYADSVGKLECFNDFYRQVSNILKTLRTLRSSKLEQGNLVDFLIRRMYIYFEKLDFKEIVEIYQNFMAYCKGQKSQKPMKQHEFMLTKSIQQVKFNLENYSTSNPQQLNKVIKELEQSDHTFKTSYIKGLLHAQQKMPISSTDNMHRYFDKSLGNLFQERIQAPGTSNKINHCILSMAYGALEMGQLDQCLQSISQGLRISQNNSDQESINNCIIYLYKIAQQLGKFREQILLAEHAITHSLNLNNLTLMLYSCLSYSYFEKYYDCEDPALMILKSRHISWTDALHFSKKKIYSSFENNCKNIYHNHRNLLIPSFLHKLAILLHLPELSTLLINPYYQRPELLNLQVYKQFKNENHLNLLIQKADRYFKLGQTRLLNKTLDEIQVYQKTAHFPKQIIEIDSFKIKMKIEKKQFMQAYQQTEKLLEFCSKNGFVKLQYFQLLNSMNRILIDSDLHSDALVRIQEVLRLSQKFDLQFQIIQSLLLKAEVYLYMQSFNEPLQILKQIQQSGLIFKAEITLQKEFYRVKKEVVQTILQSTNQSQFKQQYGLLFNTLLQCFDKLIGILIDSIEFSKVQLYLVELLQCLKTNQSFPLKNKKEQQVKQTLTYVQKVIKVYSETKTISSDDQLLAKKVSIKMRKWYFRN